MMRNTKSHKGNKSFMSRGMLFVTLIATTQGSFNDPDKKIFSRTKSRFLRKWSSRMPAEGTAEEWREISPPTRTRIPKVAPRSLSRTRNRTKKSTTSSKGRSVSPAGPRKVKTPRASRKTRGLQDHRRVSTPSGTKLPRRKKISTKKPAAKRKKSPRSQSLTSSQIAPSISKLRKQKSSRSRSRDPSKKIAGRTRSVTPQARKALKLRSKVSTTAQKKIKRRGTCNGTAPVSPRDPRQGATRKKSSALAARAASPGADGLRRRSNTTCLHTTPSLNYSQELTTIVSIEAEMPGQEKVEQVHTDSKPKDKFFEESKARISPRAKKEIRRGNETAAVSPRIENPSLPAATSASVDGLRRRAGTMQLVDAPNPVCLLPIPTIDVGLPDVAERHEMQDLEDSAEYSETEDDFDFHETWVKATLQGYRDEHSEFLQLEFPGDAKIDGKKVGRFLHIKYIPPLFPGESDRCPGYWQLYQVNHWDTDGTLLEEPLREEFARYSDREMLDLLLRDLILLPNDGMQRADCHIVGWNGDLGCYFRWLLDEQLEWMDSSDDKVKVDLNES